MLVRFLGYGKSFMASKYLAKGATLVLEMRNPALAHGLKELDGSPPVPWVLAEVQICKKNENDK